MIGHFPPPYPDELLQSVLARLATRTAPHESTKTFVCDVFGKTTVRAVVDLPSQLSLLLASVTPLWGLSVDSIIEDNTLWPFFAAFQSAEKRLKTRNEMIRVGQPYLHFGLMASGYAWPRYLRYCPICLNENRSDYKEAYWHRVHQIPGIEACPIHRCMLLSSSTLYRHARNQHEFVPAELVLPIQAPLPVPCTKIQHRLAVQSAWLLLNPARCKDAEQMREFYLHRLVPAGFADYNGYVKIPKLIRKFTAQYSADWLRQVGCGLMGTGQGWTGRVLRKTNPSPHTLRHLLLMDFLSVTAEEAISWTQHSDPFGCAPWPCLNTASNHYGKLTIERCEMSPSWNGHRLIGRFECKHCGMIYTRSGPDTQSSDRMRRDHVPVFGAVWENVLSKLWGDQSISLRGLSERLGVDPRTATLQVTRLCLPKRPGSRNIETSARDRGASPSNANLELYKMRWLDLRAQSPAASRTNLREEEPAAYAFLRRHAREWLDEHSPVPSESGSNRERVDWPARDTQITADLSLAAQKLRAWVPPVQLTSTAILREADCLWVPRRLDSLPLTAIALHKLVEDRISFALRRITAVAQSYEVQLPRWKLARLAGIRADLASVPAIREALDAFSRRMGIIAPVTAQRASAAGAP